MPVRLYSMDEFESELIHRGCEKIGTTKSGFAIWQTEDGEPFSVSPPEETVDGEKRYPDWILDDLIETVGIPNKKKPPH